MKNHNIIFKTIMFISSYFPLFIMILILWNKNIYEGIIQGKVLWILFFVLLMLMISISILSLILFTRGGDNKKICINKVSRPDYILSYIMTYIIPLISGSEISIEIFIVNFLLFILIGYIYIRLNLIYLNPLWAIFGYTIYRMEDELIIITNIPFIRIVHMESLKGYYLSNGIFVAHNKYNNIY